MNHPQWWLIVVAFLLGLVLTFALMIGRVKREVPLGVSTLGTTTKIPISGETGSKRRWPWWTSAAVVLAVAAASIVAAHNRRSPAPPNAPSPSAPPAVAANTLAGLLLPAEQIAEIVGAAHMGKGTGVSALIPDNKREIVEADCVSAWNAGQHSVYAGTGETGAYSETLRADEKPLRHTADQAVVAYPTAEAAGKVVANQFAQWTACSGRTVTSTPPPPRTPRLFTFGPVTNTGGILSMTQTSVDNAIWGCQRALAARSNVVIDIRACRTDTTNQAVDILDGIAAKIPH
jgi:serine/threonine-protein kinase